MTRKQALQIVFLTGILFGTTLPASRFALGQYHPLTFIVLRLLIASTAYLCYYRLGLSRSFPRGKRLWLAASVVGLLVSTIPLSVVILSLQYLSSGVSALMSTLTPAATVLLAAVFLRDEPMTWNKVLGAVVAFSGAGLLIGRGESGLANMAQGDWRGFALAGIAVFSNAASFVLVRRLPWKLDAFDLTGITLFISVLVLSPIALVVDGFDLSRVSVSGLLAAIYCGLVSNFAAMLLRLKVAAEYGATMTSQSEYLVPMVAVILGTLFLDERVTPVMVLGTVLIFGGIALLNHHFRQARVEAGKPGN